MTNNFFKYNYTAVLGSESRPGLDQGPQKVAGPDLDQTMDSLLAAVCSGNGSSV